jgi:hypothetical protein
MQDRTHTERDRGNRQEERRTKETRRETDERDKKRDRNVVSMLLLTLHDVQRETREQKAVGA